MKSLLVHVDTDPRCSTRVDLALTIARGFGSHVTGLHVTNPPFVPMMTHAPIPPELIEEQIRYGRERAKASESLFRGAADKAGTPVEWRSVEGYGAETLIRHGRYADLTILGQTDLDQPEFRAAPDLPDRLTLAAGSPVLVVPKAGTFPTLGERIIVAWDGGREARRAIGDALPFLKAARAVTVLVARPDRDHGDVPGADIALFLARHGVKAEAAAVHGTDIAVADQILSRAMDLGSDLIVMGAYGYPRIMEVVLGGVTRAMLSRMTVPVMLAH